MSQLGSLPTRAMCSVVGLLAVGLIGHISPATKAQGWSSYGRDAQHTNEGAAASQLPQRVKWHTPVDLQPQYTGNDLFIHYGSIMITRLNTVIVPVKTGATDGFRIEAHR